MFTEQIVNFLSGNEGREVIKLAGGLDLESVGGVGRLRRYCNAHQAGAVIELVLARQRAGEKFSRAQRMYFDRVGYEQASDQVVAGYKAKRFAGMDVVADLCCGVGGDLLGLAGQVPLVVGVDRDPGRVRMAGLNAEVWGLEKHVGLVCGDVSKVHVDCRAFHIDPDRRVGGSKSVSIWDMMPGPDCIDELLERIGHGAIKLSPAVDYKNLPWDCEVEIISRSGQCRQAVLWFGKFSSCARRATVLPEGASVDDSWPVSFDVGPIDRYLFDPDPAVSRADLLGQVAGQFGLSYMAAGLVCLTGDQQLESPFFTCFGVQEVMGWHAPKVRRYLSEQKIGQVEIKPRGVKIDVDALARQFRTDGQGRRTLFVLRLDKKVICVVCQRVKSKDGGLITHPA